MAANLLLDLPAEILDAILEHVILFKRTAPSTIAEASKNRKSPIKACKNPESTSSWSREIIKDRANTRYEDSGNIDASSPLLLVNKHIRYRVKAILARLFPHGPDYTLDVLFVDESELLPTWLQVPMLSKNVNSVEVTIRLAGNYRKGRRRLFARGDGGPPSHVWMWLNLLNRFLYHGTSSSGQDDVQRFTARNINIKVTGASQEVMERDDSDQACQNFFRQQRHGMDYDAEEAQFEERLALHPKWLAKLLTREVKYMSTVEYHVAKYSLLMLERVKNMQVSYIAADGSEEVLHRVDLTQKLRDMWHDGRAGEPWENRSIIGWLPSQCRVLTFWNWKLHNLQNRRLYFDDPDPRSAKWPSLEVWKTWQIQLEEYRKRMDIEGQRWNSQHGRCLCANTLLTNFLQEMHDDSLHQTSEAILTG